MSLFEFFGAFRSRRTFPTEWRWLGDVDVSVDGVGIEAMLSGSGESDDVDDFGEAAVASGLSGGGAGNS